MLMMWALISCAEIRAQEIQKVSNDSIALQEVVVKAARVVNKEDGKLIFPSDIQKQRSFSGFSLLGKLALPPISGLMRLAVPFLLPIIKEKCRFVSMAFSPICMTCRCWMLLLL